MSSPEPELAPEPAAAAASEEAAAPVLEVAAAEEAAPPAEEKATTPVTGAEQPEEKAGTPVADKEEKATTPDVRQEEEEEEEEVVPDMAEEDMALLLKETRFTQGEIEKMWQSCKGDHVTREQFNALCATAMPGSATAMQGLLWATFDDDENDTITARELIVSLSTCLRGNLDDLSGFFFNLYDTNNDDSINEQELTVVFSELVAVSKGVPATALTPKQKEKLHAFFLKADAMEGGEEDGQLNMAEFKAAVLSIAEPQTKPPFLTKHNVWLVFITAFFEMGTSFALPAMGALPRRIQHRFGVGAADIGFAMGVYYAGAIVGPMCGGIFMDKHGPALTVIIANLVVLIGATLQAVANGQDQWWLLIVGRMILGAGGDVTPFATVEILNRLFPDDFMLMAGIRNLIQSGSNFLSIVVLAMLAASVGPEPACMGAAAQTVAGLSNGSWAGAAAGMGDPVCAAAMDEYNGGTSAALWLCVAIACVSVTTNTVVYFMYFHNAEAVCEDVSKLGGQLRGFALAITPKPVGKCEDFKMPTSLWPVIYGIKAQYFAAYAFIAFSSILFREKFHMSAGEASVCTGYLSLLAGLMGPFFGPFSDKYGNRSIMLACFMIPSVIGFTLLATTDVTPWVAMTLFAVTYGFGDTVAYPVIRFIVGEARAGLGYGMYGIFGNIVSFFVPVFAGMIVTASPGLDGLNAMCGYFAVVTFLGILCWVVVRVLETSRGAVELPESELIETEAANVDAAALINLESSDSDSDSSSDEDEAGAPSQAGGPPKDEGEGRARTPPKAKAKAAAQP